MVASKCPSTLLLCLTLSLTGNVTIASPSYNDANQVGGQLASSQMNEVSDINEYDADYGKFRKAFPKETEQDDSTIDKPIETTTIAICGGGLAGLAVAIGMERRGIACRVYERAPRLRSQSQGMLALQPNGIAALKAIHPDLATLVAESGCTLKKAIGKSTDGSPPRSLLDRDKESIEKFGTAAILIQWHELQKCLAGLLPDDVIATGRSLRSFEEKDDHVLVRFEDGSVVKCQAMLACDGTFSQARQQILPDDSPIFFGQLNWNSILPTRKLPDELRHPPNTVTVIRHDGNDGELCKWSSFFNDCGNGYTFWQLRMVDPEKSMSLSGSSGRGGLGLSGIKEALRPLVEPSPELTAVLDCTSEERIFERCIIARKPAATWLSPRGRVAMVGDAAHAMHPNIGQGGNSAFESAAAAIHALQECKGNFLIGLRKYESIRKPRADLVQRYANMMGCFQASGSMPLEQSHRLVVDEWTKRSLPVADLDLPSHAMKELRDFDPCAEPLVSYLS